MPNHLKTLDTTFKALADPTRLAIVDRLSRGDASVSELAAPFDMSLPAVHQHLGVLEDAGLISCTKQGRVRTCRLESSRLRAAERWMASRRAFWEGRLDMLSRHLADDGGRRKR